ncbi:circadian clock KaiB family protein [Flavobacterium subsaxonicum]|uniref:KaiB domain-containing protein n=1 Tax=Flavobacterium subsaxonicum WB 4.1-42 = DSM 21790 TaxID=1121898 RepID=A0A0A2MT17_9FLAO|nr:circadian clock KaiB family protein [Flavobacterium subsaxonicum]KGO91380.1 KaiB domain-containing protein [Flavobacterium subsaxonicum WB 4.1-42 = DSM 21790]
MQNTNTHTEDTEEHKFLLFVSGMSVKSGRAIENLRKICDEHLAGKFNLEIIDIARHKEEAVHHQIIAIPTLIKLQPGVQKIILGDLSDTQKVLRILELNQ